MPLFSAHSKLQRLEDNTSGRDFVVGDLHGSLDAFRKGLQALNFDPLVDRMFSVGDLVDRGTRSQETAELVYETWFYAVLGNHEQMMIDSLVHSDRYSHMMWQENGGHWYYSSSAVHIKMLAEDLESLPLVYVVGKGPTRFHVVHAQLAKREYGQYVDITNEIVDQWNFSIQDETAMTWGRSLAAGNRMMFNASGLSPTYVGHTPMDKVLVNHNHVHLDSGVTFDLSRKREAVMVFAEPAKQLIHKFNTTWRTITTESIHNLTTQLTNEPDLSTG